VLLLPLRLRLRSSSSTAGPLKLYPLPNPYSHNPWYKKRGRPTPASLNLASNGVREPLVRFSVQTPRYAPPRNRPNCRVHSASSRTSSE
jgi:hypothetical protein